MTSFFSLSSWRSRNQQIIWTTLFACFEALLYVFVTKNIKGWEHVCGNCWPWYGSRSLPWTNWLKKSFSNIILSFHWNETDFLWQAWGFLWNCYNITLAGNVCPNEGFSANYSVVQLFAFIEKCDYLLFVVFANIHTAYGQTATALQGKYTVLIGKLSVIYPYFTCHLPILTL